ncbi:flagellar motor protein MotB [Myxococcota bacterium]|nr:flagellar motor protein MotB [Myxococcota bacterium]MBU1432672.1 flagellar motor protein MotB [Myxococcota bacterium]MBU1897022.1 flagellar motor protein MotB [Myxococcota bacterium]
MERRTQDDNEGWLLSYADLITNLLIFFVMLLSAAEISQSKMQKIQQRLSGKASPTSLASIQKEVDAQIRAQNLEGLVTTELTDDGLKLSLNSGLVFDSGAALVKVDLEPVLASMLNTLVPYSKRYRFAVEGHTDDRPIAAGGRYASNWELSTARANAVRQRLEGVGVDAERVRVEGYADTRPLPEAALEGLSPEERLARHRRVIVRIY